MESKRSKVVNAVCPICGKEVEGYVNVDYQMKQHFLAKHPEKVTIEGL